MYALCSPKFTPYIFPLGNPGEVLATVPTRPQENTRAERKNPMNNITQSEGGQRIQVRVSDAAALLCEMSLQTLSYDHDCRKNEVLHQFFISEAISVTGRVN